MNEKLQVHKKPPMPHIGIYIEHDRGKWNIKKKAKKKRIECNVYYFHKS